MKQTSGCLFQGLTSPIISLPIPDHPVNALLSAHDIWLTRYESSLEFEILFCKSISYLMTKILLDMRKPKFPDLRKQNFEKNVLTTNPPRWCSFQWVASFTKKVYCRLAKRPLKNNERFANRQLTSLVKDATVKGLDMRVFCWTISHAVYIGYYK